MIRARATPDGLPFRVYERFGKLRYSIGYKLPSGRWAFRFQCDAGDAAQVRALRRKAIEESTRVADDRPIGGFAGLVEAWFEWQEELPDTDERKRADSTIAENRREAAMLKAAWGQYEVAEITRTMGYDYLDACLKAVDADGNPRPRPEKGNKEIALARLILEFAIRKGMIETNPLDKLQHNKVKKEAKRYVTDDEMECALVAGRWMGGPYLIIALALKTAWLCVRRSVEVRSIQRDAVREDGIHWQDSKDPTKPPVVIEWSPELRATIDEVIAIKRNDLAGSFLLFGNMQGQRYTKPGWGKLLGTLMAGAEEVAAALELEFRHFSLQDCRPKGVSDKLDQGHTDTQDATLHSDGKMIARIYDRRQLRRATPAA